MLKYDNLFVNEDISKPENRLNLAIFHLQMNYDFHEWFCNKLSISPDALIYPKVSHKGKRPDYVIEINGIEIGVVEVELGNEDKSQLIDYGKEYERVFSISGKLNHNSHLSLDEIRYFIKNNFGSFENNQSKLSATYLTKLIDNYSNDGKSSKRSPVRDDVLNRPFVSKLLKQLGNYKPIDNQNKAIPGKYYIDTNSPKGFSFRAYSKKSTLPTNSTALFSITKGTDNLFFLSEEWYQEYLGHKLEKDVMRWVNFIKQDLNLPIDKICKKQKLGISIDSVNNHLDRLIELIIKLL